MQLSNYQQQILEAVENRVNTSSNKGIIIEALAGCGKSYTLKLIAERLSKLGVKGEDCRFVVFGKKNKADLQGKLSSIGKSWENAVKTLNSLGYEILRDALGKRASSFNVDRDKYTRIAQEFNYVDSVDRWGGKIKGTLTTPIKNSDEQAIKSEGILIDLIDKLRGDCVEEITSESVNNTINRYGLEIKYYHVGEVTKAVKHIIEIGHHRAIEKLHIDFCDQSWILYLERETPAFKRAFNKFRNSLRFIAVDEAQDTDKLQIEMIKLLHGDNNFICPVGDKWQAVYFFRGCLSDGMDKMKESFNCEPFELPINFRCGKKHLELVREIYPKIQIQPHDNAPEGEIICIKESEFIASIGDYQSLSHFAICRKNAPLLTFAIRCLTNEIPARIKDKQLAGKIVYRVEQVCQKRYDKSLFLMQLDKWKTESLLSIEKLPERIQEIKKQEITDYSECMTALFEKFQPISIKEWWTCIESICDEEKNGNFVDFFSIHSGKGGEGDRSFIIYPHLQPVDYKGQPSEEYQQEKNMIYVALTRTLAKKPDGGKLFLVLQERENGGVYWPSWLPNEYRNLEGEDEATSELIPLEQKENPFVEAIKSLVDDKEKSNDCTQEQLIGQLRREIREYFEIELLDQTVEQPGIIEKAVNAVIQVATGTDGRNDIEWRLEKYFSPPHREAVGKFAHRYCDIIEGQFSAIKSHVDENDDEYRDWAGLPRKNNVMDAEKKEETEAMALAACQGIATTQTAETIDNSSEDISIDANCSQKQFSQFELGLKVGLSIPLEQLTNDQKREKVKEIITTSPKLSSRAIASELGFANSFVSKVRKELTESGEIEPPDEVLDQKGRLMNVSQIKGKRKPLQEKLEALIKQHQPSEDEVKELILMLQNYLIF